MGIEKLKNILEPVSNKLRNIRSHDEHDYWLVQEIGFEPDEYENSSHVLVGCPQDEGVRRNNGRTGAAEAPDKIRASLFKMQIPRTTKLKLFDAGNVNINENGKDTDQDILIEWHQKLTKAVSQFLEDGKKVIVLGGGNDISYADVRALAKVEKKISAINIDAHLDMRRAKKMTSGTPYRKLIEDGVLHPKHFYEFGIRPQSNAAYYLDKAHEMKVNIHYFHDILKDGVGASIKKIVGQIGERPFFLGLDMDSIQAADAPGASASSPLGFSGREVIQIFQHVKKKKNLKVVEITEVNPRYDIDGRTSKLAAEFLYKFLVE